MILIAQILHVEEMRAIFHALMGNIAFGRLLFVMAILSVKMNQGTFYKVFYLITLRGHPYMTSALRREGGLAQKKM